MQPSTQPTRARVPSVGFVLDGQCPQRERGKGVPSRTVAPSALPSFGQHIRSLPLPEAAENAADARDLKKELVKVLEAIEQGVKDISLLLRYGLRTTDPDALHSDAIPKLSSGDGPTWKREVIRHDERAGEMLLDMLRSTRTCAVALETHEGVIDWCHDDYDDDDDDGEGDANGGGGGSSGDGKAAAAPAAVSYDPYDYYSAPTSTYTTKKQGRKARFAVVLDPLGHAQLADAGANVGTIFGIYLATGDDQAPSSHILKNNGSALLAAGYALYGSATQLVLSMGGNGVDGFTLHPILDSFTLTRPRIMIADVGRFYSVNLGHRSQWSGAVQRHIDGLGESKSLRYLGTYLSDVHRTLLYGGVFVYPASRKRQAGKVRLLFEAIPIAFLVEQAGGACSTGKQRLLDVQPMSINQRTPVAFGSRADVEAYVRDCNTELSPTYSPPTAPRRESGGELTGVLEQPSSGIRFHGLPATGIRRSSSDSSVESLVFEASPPLPRRELDPLGGAEKPRPFRLPAQHPRQSSPPTGLLALGRRSQQADDDAGVDDEDEDDEDEDEGDEVERGGTNVAKPASAPNNNHHKAPPPQPAASPPRGLMALGWRKRHSAKSEPERPALPGFSPAKAPAGVEVVKISLN